MLNDYKRFDVVMVDFGDNVIGSEQGHIRPALIIQNNCGNLFSTSTIVMPFSSKIKKVNQPTHTLIKKNEINGLKVDSMLLGEQIRAISEQRIIKKLGLVDDEKTQKEVRKVYEANFGE